MPHLRHRQYYGVQASECWQTLRWNPSNPTNRNINCFHTGESNLLLPLKFDGLHLRSIWGTFEIYLRPFRCRSGSLFFFWAWFGSGKPASFFASISIKPPFASGFLTHTARQWNDGWWIYHAFPGSAGVEADSQTGWMTFENTRLAKCDSIQYLIHTGCKKWHSVRHHWTLCLIIRLVMSNAGCPTCHPKNATNHTVHVIKTNVYQ